MKKSIHHQNLRQCLDHYLNPMRLLWKYMIKRKRAQKNGKKITFFALHIGICSYELLYRHSKKVVATTLISIVVISMM